MAICNLNNNILRENYCGYQLGSITMLYFINSSDISATTVDTASGQTVDSITFNTGGFVYAVEPAKGSANWSDTLVVNDDGTKHRTHQVTFNILGNLTNSTFKNYAMVDGRVVVMGFEVIPTEQTASTIIFGPVANLVLGFDTFDSHLEYRFIDMRETTGENMFRIIAISNIAVGVVFPELFTLSIP